MHPDYSQLWRNLNEGHSPEAQFYTFFEDNLNQFISTNCNNNITVASGDTVQVPQHYNSNSVED